MATRKEPIDIAYNEPQQEAVSGSAESNGPYESQDPADWVPPMTVRIYPISRPRSKLLATANVNIAKSFAVQGFRIYDSKNGLFVKEPQRSYVKNGTEMTSSVFFPSPRRPGTPCTARFSTPTNWSWSSRSASTPTRRTNWKNCWKTAIYPLPNLMRLPLPLWTRTPPL